MPMDWNKGAVLLAQSVVVVVLGALVATGHDSLVTDALLVLSGSITGTGLYAQVKAKRFPDSQ